MLSIRYRVTETVVYEIDVEIDDGLDPNSERACKIATETFCGLETTEMTFLEVQARSVEPA